MRKPAFCIDKNKGVDQLHGNDAADKCLCFRYIDSTIHFILSPKSHASYHLLWLYSLVCVRHGRKTLKQVFS